MAYAVLVTAVFAWRVDDDVTAPNVDKAAFDAPLPERVRIGLPALIAEPGFFALAVLALFALTANWG